MAAANDVQGKPERKYTPTNPNVFGMNGLNVFELTDSDGSDFLTFTITNQQNFVRLTDQQAEKVCLDLLQHLYEKRRRLRG